MIDVLLVEPDAILARAYKKYFEKKGLNVDVQSDAQGAVHSVDQQVPKVIVLDLQLGEHNGIEFIYELRSHADWRNIPLLIQSTIPYNDLGLNTEISNQLGIEKVLYKPKTSLQQLTQHVFELKGSD